MWDGDGSYLVNPSGDGDYNYYNVSSSYGRILRSPDADWGDRAYFVYPDGVVIYGEFVYSGSYGVLSPDIRYTSFWWVDISGTLDSYLHNDVSYYCGNFSPYTNGSNLAWRVNSSGDVGGGVFSDVYYNSYGRILRSPYTDYSGFAWLVRSDGVVVYGEFVYSGSYGKRSPSTRRTIGNVACLVLSDGDVNVDYGTVYDYSYGRKIAGHEVRW